MKYKFLLTVLFLSICSCKTGVTKPAVDSNKKVEIVSPDYGILSTTERTRAGLLPLMWKCFPIKDVEVKYRTWRDADPLGPYDVIVTMCDFEMFVKSNSITHVYHGRRGKPVSYCDEFKVAWTKLTNGEKHICMDGETLTKGEPEEDEASKKMKASWTWDKIKTKKGCYSFWTGYQCADF